MLIVDDWAMAPMTEIECRAGPSVRRSWKDQMLKYGSWTIKNVAGGRIGDGGSADRQASAREMASGHRN